MASIWDSSGATVTEDDDFWRQLQTLYANNNRGAASAAEVEAHRQNPGGLAAIDALLKADNAAAGASSIPVKSPMQGGYTAPTGMDALDKLLASGRMRSASGGSGFTWNDLATTNAAAPVAATGGAVPRDPLAAIDAAAARTGTGMFNNVQSQALAGLRSQVVGSTAATTAGATDDYANQVRAAYAAVGRQAPSEAEIDSHRANPRGIDGVKEMLARNAGGNDSLQAPGGRWDANWFSSNIGRPNTVAELVALEGKINAAGGKLLRNAAGVPGKIQTPDGRIVDVMIAAGLGGQGFQWDEGGGAASGGGTGYGNSASTELFMNEILNRLAQLREPVSDPFRDLLQATSLKQIEQLSGAPYTAGEDALLMAKYREPLTQTRDTLRQQALERAGARGFAPSSGLIQESLGQIDAGYEQGIAQGANALGLQAVDQKRANEQQILNILGNLFGVSSNARAEQESQRNQVLQVAAMLPDMDERRLQMLLAASGEGASSPSSISSILTQLNSQLTGQQNTAAQNSQANSAAWGNLIAQILGGLTGG